MYCFRNICNCFEAFAKERHVGAKQRQPALRLLQSAARSAQACRLRTPIALRCNTTATAALQRSSCCDVLPRSELPTAHSDCAQRLRCAATRKRIAFAPLLTRRCSSLRRPTALRVADSRLCAAQRRATCKVCSRDATEQCTYARLSTACWREERTLAICSTYLGPWISWISSTETSGLSGFDTGFDRRWGQLWREQPSMISRRGCARMVSERGGNSCSLEKTRENSSPRPSV